LNAPEKGNIRHISKPIKKEELEKALQKCRATMATANPEHGCHTKPKIGARSRELKNPF